MKISVSVFAHDLLKKRGTLLEQFFRDKRFQKKDLATTFNKLKKAGIEGVELWIPNKFSGKDVKNVKRILQSYAIPVLSLHQPIRLLSTSTIKEIEGIFVIAQALDAKLITLHTDMARNQIFQKKYIEGIKRLEKKFKIFACFENMQKHHILIRKPHYWDGAIFSKVTRKNNLFIAFDTTHLAQTQGNIISFFEKNKDRIKNIHISDFKDHLFSSSFFPNKNMHMPLGKGDLPLQKFFHVLKENNYQGNLTLEIVGTIDDLGESSKYIQEHFI